MSNFEKLTHAGIIGTPHVITAGDLAAIEALTHHEVETLIAVKSKLGEVTAKDSDDSGPPNPVGTISF